MVYQLKRKQQLRISLDTAWDFFSNPKNLNEITPKDMCFRIVSELEDKMYQGQVILYQVSPVLNIPTTWLTEITHVEDKKYFVDNQVVGPYSLWHHQHKFTENKNGVLMEDIVTYKLPFGILGKLAHTIFVKKKLEHIFDYRFQYLEKKFNQS
ncbi:MAG: SRPBCC family protein [Flavobacteriales bacterium]|nr:SRPBCC family protein [Flavobacteriales bacterium]